MKYKNNVKCSVCGAEAKSNVGDYPFTCGLCGKVAMEFVSDIKKRE